MIHINNVIGIGLKEIGYFFGLTLSSLRYDGRKVSTTSLAIYSASDIEWLR